MRITALHNVLLLAAASTLLGTAQAATGKKHKSADDPGAGSFTFYR